MAYEVDKVDVWTAEIADQPGALDKLLGVLGDAGVDLSFLVARRQPHLPGRGVVYLGGVSGARGTKTAAKAGLSKANDIAGLRVVGKNKAGACHELTKRLADAGISLRGASATTIGSKFAMVLAFDSAADAGQAAKLIRAIK
jgi:hypothetical protein